MTGTHPAPRKWELTDIPGIGPGLAERLRRVEILSIDDFKAAPLDHIASVQGISRAQASEMKAYCRVFRQQDGRLDTSSPETIWEHVAQESRRRLCGLVSELKEHAGKHKLKRKFRAQLSKLEKVLDRLPSVAPLDEEQRDKILKHMRALEKLLTNAALLQPGDDLHQRVMRDRVRYRRKKLDKWIGHRVAD